MHDATRQSSSEILGRVLIPHDDDIPPGLAQWLLTLQFGDRDRRRMRELLAKARNGTITPQEEDEADAYERVGHLLSRLHSVARRSLP